MEKRAASDRPAARLLDLTRLVSRAGRGPMTGIDRVEAAYLARLLVDPTPLFALIKTSLGYVLLDKSGANALHEKFLGATPWGSPDLLSRFFLKSDKARRAAESDLRRLCVARSGRGGLARMLVRYLPAQTAWLNVGHSNLEAQVFDAVHALPGGRAQVLVHDMIPLDFPQFQRPGTVELFERRMRNVAAHADLVIYNSAQSQRDGERVFGGWGRVPEGLVAHLGVERCTPAAGALPPGLDLTRPYFVTIGTIEPRKNHALLLDVWAALAAEMGNTPQLFIIGGRGWNNAAVFARLDASPSGVVELNGLSDGAMAALIKGARAALFPSLAEGFGLPPCEAVLLGTRVVATDLPVTREILGNIPIYANGMDMYSWLKIIRDLSAAEEAEQSADRRAKAPTELPTWQDHFNLTLKVM